MKYNQILKSEVPSSGLLQRYNVLSRLLLIVYSLVVVIALANLIGTNTLATQGVVLDKILSESRRINRENQNLQLEISRTTNLSYIESTAVKLGFKRITTNLTISTPDAVAAVFQQ